MVDRDAQPLIIDCGTDRTQCGFGGDDAPRRCFPTVTGTVKNTTMCGICYPKIGFYAGAEADAKRGILHLKCPLTRGCITDWSCMEKILKQSFWDLRVTPDEGPVLLTEHPLQSKGDREQMLTLLFENLNVSAAYFGVSAVMALYASGRTTGLVVESGHGVTHTVPCYEGHDIPHTVLRMEVAGDDITGYLVKLLRDRGYEMTTSAEREVVKDIKTQLGYVAFDYDDEMEEDEHAHRESEYTLPDGSRMEVLEEKFRAPEILFTPSLIDSESPGLQELVTSSLRKCDRALHKDLYQNIVLAGGSTMFDGIVERLSKEVQNLAPVNARVKVNAPCERKYSVWIGASILSSLATFQRMWITKQEFGDIGASIVHRRCF